MDALAAFAATNLRRCVTLIAALALGAFALAGATATAHEAPTDQVDHHAEDQVVHSAGEERALGKRTRELTATDAKAAAAAVSTDPAKVGRWGPVMEWPVAAISAALLPNGKVLAFDSVGDRASESYEIHDRTRAMLWDPATGGVTRVDAILGVNIFCSGLAHLSDGSIFTAGGNKDNALHGISATTVFDPVTSTWKRTAEMKYERWYPSVTPLNNGEMLITEGGPTIPEVREVSGAIRELSTASYLLPLYPWLDVGPGGRAFYTGPDTTLRSIDARGTGTWSDLGPRDEVDRDYGSHVMYDIGKVLVSGGGIPAQSSAVTIDLNGTWPAPSPTAPMASPRRQHNLTVLADGTVLATGGLSSSAPLVDLANGVYSAERWNPATGNWTTLASERITRQYHSTALLLPDGRVLSAGGGICTACDAAGYLAKNAEVFSPPYLFRNDGSGRLATRPAISSAPSQVGYNAGLQIRSGDASSIRKVALIRLGAVTHSVNMDQRYVPLRYSANSRYVNATSPANANVAPPGVYMLVITNSAGVPSVARMVRVG